MFVSAVTLLDIPFVLSIEGLDQKLFDKLWRKERKKKGGGKGRREGGKEEEFAF